MTLPAPAASRRAAAVVDVQTHRAATDRHRLLAGPTAANPPQRRAAAECWDRQTETDTVPFPAVHYASSVDNSQQ